MLFLANSQNLAISKQLPTRAPNMQITAFPTYLLAQCFPKLPNHPISLLYHSVQAFNHSKLSNHIKNTVYWSIRSTYNVSSDHRLTHSSAILAFLYPFFELNTFPPNKFCTLASPMIFYRVCLILLLFSIYLSDVVAFIAGKLCCCSFVI